LKIIFDATFGEGWVDALMAFFRIYKEPRPRFQHIHDVFNRDLPDDVWIPKFAEIDCLIISGDAGRKKPRLPAICKQFNKTHIILSPTLQNSSKFNQARAIVVLWPEIVNTFSHSKGSRFQIQTTDAKHEHFRLVKKD